MENELGVTIDNISKHIKLLQLYLDSIKGKVQILQNLPIEKLKIVKNPALLFRNNVTMTYIFNNLRKLGVLTERISTYPTLLELNPDALSLNFRYLISLGVNRKRVQYTPQLLAMNPDAFAKALHIFKLGLLSLKILDEFDVNIYRTFFTHSPASFLAKIQYLTENEFEHAKIVWHLIHSWQKMIKYSSF